MSPTTGAVTRAPTVVCNGKGEVLFVWGTVGKQLKKGAGHVVWQRFSSAGEALSKKEALFGAVASSWGAATACVRPDGGFVVLYDGEGPK